MADAVRWSEPAASSGSTTSKCCLRQLEEGYRGGWTTASHHGHGQRGRVGEGLGHDAVPLGEPRPWIGSDRIDWSGELDPDNPVGVPDDIIPIVGTE